MSSFSLDRVPFLADPQIEAVAMELLRLCARARAKAAAPPVDVEFIAEGVLSLSYGVDDLSHLGQNVLGATWFDEAMVKVDTSLENKFSACGCREVR